MWWGIALGARDRSWTKKERDKKRDKVSKSAASVVGHRSRSARQKLEKKRERERKKKRKLAGPQLVWWGIALGAR